MKKANVIVFLEDELVEELRKFYLSAYSYPDFVKDLISGKKDIVIPRLSGGHYSASQLIRWSRLWCKNYLDNHPEFDVIMCQFKNGSLVELINKINEEILEEMNKKSNTGF